jgi:DNA-binding NarL/FixJ family response regulator
MKPRHRILLVDDHPIVRYGIYQLLSSQPDLVVCGEAETAEEALQLIEKEAPHLVVIDITLRDSNGLELIKQIRSAHPSIYVLVVTMHEESLYGELAFRAGAQGYLMKEEAMANIAQAIRQILAGKLFISETLSSRILRVSLSSAGAAEKTPIERLTPREREVLQLLGQWKTTRDIARELNVSYKTADCYREKLKEKLDLKNATELVQFATRWVQQQQLKKSG